MQAQATRDECSSRMPGMLARERSGNLKLPWARAVEVKGLLS